MGRYLLIQHSETNETMVIDTYLSRYKRIGQGFLNKVRLEGLFVKHLVLTQAEESYKPNHLNNFFNRVRREFGAVCYVWTTEVQEKRREKYGDAVLHWHVMIGFPGENYESFGVDRIKLLQKFWKYGNLEVRGRGRSRMSLSYLMKYITKTLDVNIEGVEKVRRMGSSRIEGYLRQSMTAFVTACSKFMSWGLSQDAMGWFTWSRGSAYAKEDGGGRICVYQRAASGWYALGSMENPQLSPF